MQFSEYTMIMYIIYNFAKQNVKYFMVLHKGKKKNFVHNLIFLYTLLHFKHSNLASEL